jgi:hypothetical protein
MMQLSERSEEIKELRQQQQERDAQADEARSRAETERREWAAKEREWSAKERQWAAKERELAEQVRGWKERESHWSSEAAQWIGKVSALDAARTESEAAERRAADEVTTLRARLQDLESAAAEREAALAAARAKAVGEAATAEELRRLYMEGTAFVAETRTENEMLRQQAAIAEGQAHTGVALVRAEAGARIKKLEGDLQRERDLVALLTARAQRTDDAVRERAALEPEWRRRVSVLERVDDERTALADQQLERRLCKMERTIKAEIQAEMSGLRAEVVLARRGVFNERRTMLEGQREASIEGSSEEDSDFEPPSVGESSSEMSSSSSGSGSVVDEERLEATEDDEDAVGLPGPVPEPKPQLAVASQLPAPASQLFSQPTSHLVSGPASQLVSEPAAQLPIQSSQQLSEPELTSEDARWMCDWGAGQTGACHAALSSREVRLGSARFAAPSYHTTMAHTLTQELYRHFAESHAGAPMSPLALGAVPGCARAAT